MGISTEQARALAERFLTLSQALGTYRFGHWGELTPEERDQIKDSEWELLTRSSGLMTKAVDGALNDLHADLHAITDATGEAKKVIATINTVKAVIGVATALVTLAGAIATKDPGTIIGAVQGLQDAVNKAHA